MPGSGGNWSAWKSSAITATTCHVIKVSKHFLRLSLSRCVHLCTSTLQSEELRINKGSAGSLEAILGGLAWFCNL
jgi:hypothetical protein